jgi:hypothetical protein
VTARRLCATEVVEMTVVTAIAAFGLVADNGFVDRPGPKRSEPPTPRLP